MHLHVTATHRQKIQKKKNFFFCFFLNEKNPKKNFFFWKNYHKKDLNVNALFILHSQYFKLIYFVVVT